MNKRETKKIGERVVTATVAKNEFGSLLESAVAGQRVLVTKHGVAKAVLLSIADYNALTGAGRARLDSLHTEFDSLLDSMQSPESEVAMKRAFEASPLELGQAALEAAQRTGA